MHKFLLIHNLFSVLFWHILNHFLDVCAFEFSPNEPMLNLKTYGLNWPSVWVKMVSSWICIIIFFISLCFPQCLPGGKHDGGSKPWAGKGLLVWKNTMLRAWLLSGNLWLKIAVSEIKLSQSGIISSSADIIFYLF